MRHFMVSYDLHNDRNYPRITDELERIGGVRLLESLWLISLENKTPEVRDHFKQYIDKDDSIAVLELKAGSGWACIHAKDEGVNWLRQNIQA